MAPLVRLTYSNALCDGNRPAEEVSEDDFRASRISTFAVESSDKIELLDGEGTVIKVLKDRSGAAMEPWRIACCEYTDCPKCNQPKGSRCVGLNGDPRVSVHGERAKIYREHLADMTTAPVTDQMEWTCVSCRQSIADGDGYIHVAHADVARYEAWWQADMDKRREHGESMVSRPAWDDHPDIPRWLAHHRGCDPRPESRDYCIDVARVRTQAHLISWTSHLLGKTWLQFTDWGHFLEDVAHLNGYWAL